jgi:hypothetical protein
MPSMPISKAKALELLERHIALLHEKRRTARDSTRSSYAYDDFHGVYHCAVVLLARLFDADDAEAFRRQLTLPSLSRGGMPERDRQVGNENEYDQVLGQAILQLELRQASIRDLWPDEAG